MTSFPFNKLDSYLNPLEEDIFSFEGNNFTSNSLNSTKDVYQLDSLVLGDPAMSISPRNALGMCPDFSSDNTQTEDIVGMEVNYLADWNGYNARVNRVFGPRGNVYSSPLAPFTDFPSNSIPHTLSSSGDSFSDFKSGYSSFSNGGAAMAPAFSHSRSLHHDFFGSMQSQGRFGPSESFDLKINYNKVTTDDLAMFNSHLSGLSNFPNTPAIPNILNIPNISGYATQSSQDFCDVPSISRYGTSTSREFGELPVYSKASTVSNLSTRRSSSMDFKEMPSCTKPNKEYPGKNPFMRPGCDAETPSTAAATPTGSCASEGYNYTASSAARILESGTVYASYTTCEDNYLTEDGEKRMESLRNNRYIQEVGLQYDEQLDNSPLEEKVVFVRCGSAGEPGSKLELRREVKSVLPAATSEELNQIIVESSSSASGQSYLPYISWNSQSESFEVSWWMADDDGKITRRVARFFFSAHGGKNEACDEATKFAKYIEGIIRPGSLIQWYPGFNIPIGTNGRTNLRKVLHMDRLENAEHCDPILEANGLKIATKSTFGDMVIVELYRAAYVLGLWDVAAYNCLKTCKRCGYAYEWISALQNRKKRITLDALKYLRNVREALFAKKPNRHRSSKDSWRKAPAGASKRAPKSSKNTTAD